MGFVWVHADSFLRCVASPLHSFVTTETTGMFSPANTTTVQLSCSQLPCLPARSVVTQEELTSATLYNHACGMSAGDASVMADFCMTALKPLHLSWLYACWSRGANDPAIVVWGWDPCGTRVTRAPGLRCMIDDRYRRVQTARNSKRAM